MNALRAFSVPVVPINLYRMGIHALVTLSVHCTDRSSDSNSPGVILALGIQAESTHPGWYLSSISHSTVHPAIPTGSLAPGRAIMAHDGVHWRFVTASPISEAAAAQARWQQGSLLF